MEAQVEFLSEELKGLIGWGAHPKRLPLLSGLSSLANVPEEASFVSAGYIIRRYLLQAIDSLEGAYEFYGRTIPAEKLRRALRLLLQYEGTGLNAVNRRYRAIMLLGVRCSVEQWRRPYGPESDLMLLFASEIAKAAPNLQG